MQRQSEKQSVVWSTVMGFMCCWEGVIPVAAAEDTKKPAEQAAPAAKKTP
jgi:fructose-specific phosphotransferase system IIC component